MMKHLKEIFKCVFMLSAFAVLLVSAAAAYNGELSVYLTYKDGEPYEYHFSDCWRIGESRIPMTLENAIDKGFEPCPWCEPPERLTKKPDLPVYSGEEHDFEAYRAFWDENRMAYELQEQLDQAELNDILFAHSQTFGAKIGFTAPTIFWVAVFSGIFVVIAGICVFSFINHSRKKRSFHDELR